MNPIRSLRCILSACLLLSLQPAGAQNILSSLANPPKAAAQPLAPQPVSDATNIAELVTQADDDEQLLQRVVRYTDSPATYARLSSTLEDISNGVDAKQREFTEKSLLSLPVMRLESLGLNWQFDARRLAQWQAEAQDYNQTYFSDTAELGKHLDQWQNIRAHLKPNDLPEALLERIDALIKQLKNTRNEIAGPLSKQLELRQRASALDARIREGQRLTNAAIGNIDRRLLSLDAPPLWAAQPVRAATPSIQSIDDGLEIELRFAKEYRYSTFQNYSFASMLQYLLLPLIVWMAWLHRHNPPPASAPAHNNKALTRPLSLYVLLSMAAVLVLKSDAPLLVRESAMLIVIIPTLRLLPQSVYQTLKLWPIAISGFYLLSRLGYLFMHDAALYRLFLLGVTLLTLGVLVWRIWRVRHDDPDSKTHYSSTVRRTVQLSALLLLISTIANVVGNISLASMLFNGLVSSSYAALMLTAIITSLRGLLGFALQHNGMKRLRLVRLHGSDIFQGVARLSTFAGILGWIIYTADAFRILRPIYAAISDILVYHIEVGELSISLGDVCVFVIALYIAFWTAKIVRIVLRDEMLPRMSLPRGVGNSVATLTYYGIFVIGLMLSLSAAGFKVSQLAIIFGALGVGIGFGLQNIVGNLVSGLVLMLERPIQPGDAIEIGTISGKVREINLRSTTLRTYDGADVVLPNSTLLSNSLTNWTLFDRNRRFEIPVGVGYEADPRQVLALLAKAAQETPGILPDPAPAVLFQGFGDSAMNFTVRAWAPDYDNVLSIRSELVTHMHTALTEAGISIPFPQQDLHLRTVSEAASAALRPAAPT